MRIQKGHSFALPYAREEDCMNPTRRRLLPAPAKRWLGRATGVGVALLVSLLALCLTSTPATAGTPAEAHGMKPQDDQLVLLRELGMHHFDGIVVDSAMTYDQAMGDDVVPPKERAVHAAIKPYLRLVPVAYWGMSVSESSGHKVYTPDNKIHVGQIVVHQLLVTDTVKVFAKMFELRFPIYSVKPHSAFGYNDTLSMAANNSSAYRPDSPSEHSRGSAFDINPYQNPMDFSKYDGSAVQPAEAVYNPSAPGTITKYGAVRLYWSSLGWEWGGNWGDPAADPPTDYWGPPAFDWQHFQLGARNPDRYAQFNAQLPECLRTWSCYPSSN